MTTEVHGLLAFYASPGGALAARLLRERLAVLWPALPGLDVLGIGHAAPYLGLWAREAARCIALTPAQGALAPWPAEGRSAALLAEEEQLPFPDSSFDRVLLVHGLEQADNARRMLREVWRVLRDDGRLMVVVPNRLGLWAQMERTPFGHGQPYSPGQLSRLLGRHLFRVERRESALFVPPFGLPLFSPLARPWERLGRQLCPRLAGVAIVEAEKDLHAVIPAGAQPVRRRVVVPI
ncbi:class I SAM-dependent methyltransferase [Roseomonas sp. F4]